MNIIKRLSHHEAQKIAAGEVIERPANIVKELLENSLDAGATFIRISAHDGGKQSLTITDNGCGMSREDAHLCIERHTTSKITTVEELQTITSFGFRGEALASICSVARVTLATKCTNAQEGIKLSIEQGIVQKEASVGIPAGTTIIIDDLFYNIPARKKFLKSTSVEWNHIATLVKAYALSNPSLHIILEHNDTILYNCPSVATTQERMHQFFDDALGRNTVIVTQQTEREITLEGTITNHHYGRYDRSGIFLFVNNRWVKNYGLTNAFIKGYLNVLPTGKYPAGVLIITVPADTVDINVHPKKEEVVFTHPKVIENFITKTITAALESHLSAQVKTTVPQPIAQHLAHNTPLFQPTEKKIMDNAWNWNQYKAPVTLQKTLHENWNLSENTAKEQEEKSHTQQTLTPLETPHTQHKLIGQYNKTYLLLEHQDGLYLIDQHAAHERILYEKFGSKFEECIASPLLFPLILTLPSEHVTLLTEHASIFADYGIIFEQIGPQELCTTQLPLILKNQSIEDILKEVITLVNNESSIDHKLLKKKISEKVRAQMACKAAVKAGDLLSRETMITLLQDLEKTPNRFSCPHGRPTGWLLKLSDIERTFKRIM